MHSKVFKTNVFVIFFLQKKQFDSLTFFRLFHRQYEQTTIVLGLKTGNEIQTFEPRRYKLFSWNSVMASEELQRQQH